MPETGTIREVFGLHATRNFVGAIQEMIASKNHRRRLLTLTEMSNVAVFMASDQASAMTGSVMNLSMGMLDA